MNSHEHRFDVDDWDDAEEDEILFESEELIEPFGSDITTAESIISDVLPILPLRGVVVYPMMWLPLPIGQKRSLQLVEDNLPENRVIALVTSRDESIDEPTPDQVYEIGTAAQVHRVLKTPDGTIRLLVQGLERIRIVEYVQEEPYLRARVEAIPEISDEDLEMEALVRTVEELFRQLIDLEPQMPEELAIMAINAENPRQLAYLTASSMRIKIDDAQELLEDHDDLDMILDLGGPFKYRLETPQLTSGKVFTPNVKAVLQFSPRIPWTPLSEKEFEHLVSEIKMLE